MTMKKLIFGTLTLMLLVGLSGVGVAEASHSWGGYHWARTSNPSTLKLGDNVGNSWDAYLREASSDWNTSTIFRTSVVNGVTSPKACRGIAGRVEVCNAKYGNNNWLGLASISVDSSGHITQGTAKMNDSYFATATYNTPAWRHLVMCQEIAHTFGLDHQDEAFDNANLGTCMDYTNDPDGGPGGVSATDPSNEHPNQHDYDQLVSIYTHLDAVTTIKQATAKAFGAVGVEIRGEDKENTEFGTPIKHDRNGRANVFSKKENGQTVITHVYWLPE